MMCINFKTGSGKPEKSKMGKKIGEPPENTLFVDDIDET